MVAQQPQPYQPQQQPQPYQPQQQPQPYQPQQQPQPYQPQQQPQPYQPQQQYQPIPQSQPNINVVVNSSPQAVAGGPATVFVKQKSVLLALVLTFFFGPFGMFYSTITGAIVMLLVNIILVVPTAGLITFITWPLGMIWGGVAAASYNKRAIRL
jgi:outer membrane biosynthesis protein TonB